MQNEEENRIPAENSAAGEQKVLASSMKDKVGNNVSSRGLSNISILPPILYILSAAAWTVTAFLIFLFCMFPFNFRMWTWLLRLMPNCSFSGHGCFWGALFYIVGLYFLWPLFLLWATKRSRGLHRSMIWVLILVAAKTMFDALLPLLGRGGDVIVSLVPFYNFEALGNWQFSLAILFRALCVFLAIALHQQQERRRCQEKPGVIASASSKDVYASAPSHKGSALSLNAQHAANKAIIVIIFFLVIFFGYQKHFSNHLDELFGEWVESGTVVELLRKGVKLTGDESAKYKQLMENGIIYYNISKEIITVKFKNGEQQTFPYKVIATKGKCTTIMALEKESDYCLEDDKLAIQEKNKPYHKVYKRPG